MFNIYTSLIQADFEEFINMKLDKVKKNSRN